MKPRTYFYVGFATTLNIFLNALTFGKFLWLEGRVRGGVFRNWAKRFRYKPEVYELPTSEQEIIDLIKRSRKLRFFGAGHSFNNGIQTEETLVSLDNYAGLICEDVPNGLVTVKGGTRVRDVIKILYERGLAFGSLPSHDAQSIAGIISTDVHGTGRDWGFVSQLVEKIRLIDGTGQPHDCFPTDDLFKAAIGGVGAVGVITEVTLKAVKRFNIDQICVLEPLDDIEQKLDRLISDNDHVSLYIFPFAKKCQVNIWNGAKDKKRSLLADFREFINISLDAFTSAWIGNLMAYTGTLAMFSNFAYFFKRKTDLIMESDRAFTRSIYHLHQEFEFTIPYEDAISGCREFLSLFEEMYKNDPRELPYTLLEVRFTPAGHERTLIGAGRERRCCWIDLICNDSHGFEKYYAAAEVKIKEIGARPHLGKFGLTFDKQYFQQLYGPHFQKFLDLINLHDPDRKFENDFIRRCFKN